MTSSHRARDLQVWCESEGRKVAEAVLNLGLAVHEQIKDQKDNPFAAADFGADNEEVTAPMISIMRKSVTRLALEFPDTPVGELGFLLGIHTAAQTHLIYRDRNSTKNTTEVSDE